MQAALLLDIVLIGCIFSHADS